MGFADLILKVKKAETPFYARLKRVLLSLQVLEIPMPGFTRPFWSALYHVMPQFGTVMRKLACLLYRIPMFKSQCESVGRRLYMEQIPHISGKVRLVLGNDVTISGSLSILVGRSHENPEILLADNVFIGHGVVLQVGCRIEMEEGSALATGCYVTDNDGHPMDLGARLRKEPVPPNEVLPVRICRRAWVGRGCYVMKGVTIGEFAVVGAGSVVINDVPAYGVAIGNPARVIRTNRPPAAAQDVLD